MKTTPSLYPEGFIQSTTLKNTEGTSSKFYTLTIVPEKNDYNLIAKYGKIGAQPKEELKTTSSSLIEVQKEFLKIVLQKEKKGYHVVGEFRLKIESIKLPQSQKIDPIKVMFDYVKNNPEECKIQLGEIYNDDDKKVNLDKVLKDILNAKSPDLSENEESNSFEITFAELEEKYSSFSDLLFFIRYDKSTHSILNLGFMWQ